MERGRSRKARSGCLGRIFGFVLFLIVAAVGVIAAVKYMPSRERADLDALYAAGGSDRVALYLNYERQEEERGLRGRADISAGCVGRMRT